MARGESGRIVLEIDPSQKVDLYSALATDGLTLKDWFLRQATQYLYNKDQMSLFDSTVVAENKTPYKVTHEADEASTLEESSDLAKVKTE